MVSGAIGMFLLNRTAFACLAALMLPFIIGVIAEHVGYDVVNTWWFWVLTAISLTIGISLLVRVVSEMKRNPRSGDNTGTSISPDTER